MSSPIEPGQVYDRYITERKLGEGGMAEVWLVRHRSLGGRHALKVLRYQHAPTVQRLIQEGQLQSQMHHPNVVAVTDLIEVNGAPGLVLEYIEGPPLDRWLANNRPPLWQAEHIFRGILAGVSRAHAIKLVHRDLKPANVLLAHGPDGFVPKVADFGIAKLLEEHDAPIGGTRSGTAMGTASYMAPEQMRDAKTVDERADIWALGCILYELVVGWSPFAGDDILEIFSRLRVGEYPAPTELVPELPPRIAAAIRAAIQPDRDKRTRDCAAFKAILDGQAPPPPRLVSVTPAFHTSRQSPPASASVTRSDGGQGGWVDTPDPDQPEASVHSVRGGHVRGGQVRGGDVRGGDVSDGHVSGGHADRVAVVHTPNIPASTWALPQSASTAPPTSAANSSNSISPEPISREPDPFEDPPESPARPMWKVLLLGGTLAGLVLAGGLAGKLFFSGQGTANSAANLDAGSTNAVANVLNPTVGKQTTESPSAVAAEVAPGPEVTGAATEKSATKTTAADSKSHKTTASSSQTDVPGKAATVPSLAAAPPAPSTGSVRVTGDATHVELVDSAGRTHAVGDAVPAGRWSVRVQFDGQPAFDATTIQVAPGASAHVHCTAFNGNCRTE